MTDSIELKRRTVFGTALSGVAATVLGVSAADAAESKSRSGKTMRAYALGDRKDGKITLHMVERPALVPKYGEAVIKVHATGLGSRDIRIIKSQWPQPSNRVFDRPPPDRIPLQDSAGEVIAIGEGVTRVKIGDRVMATHYPKFIDGKWHESMMDHDFGNLTDGFLAEQTLVPAESLVRMPRNLTFEEASTLQSSGLTPYRGLTVDGKFQGGETVLTMGTGNVSVFALQIAKKLGGRVVITSSSDAKLEKMRALGADITVNYRTNPNWEREVVEKTEGRGVDIALNNIGFAGTEQCLLSCAAGGRVVILGAGSDPAVLKSFPEMLRKNLLVTSFTVASRRMFEDFVRMVETTNLKPTIDRVFPFEQALDAIQYYQTGEKIGKIVIKIA